MRKRFWLGMLLTIPLLVSCTGTDSGPVAESAKETEAVAVSVPSLAPSPTAPAPPLPDFGPAPEILNEVWINTDMPLTLASQRGKVVLVEFWTFG